MSRHLASVMTELPQQDGLSLTGRVLEALTERIRNGIYAPGTRLPTESDLSTEFNVSRGTIRHALGTLSERALIIRRPGDGTYVAELAMITNPLNHQVLWRERIADHGFEPGFVSLSADVTEAKGQVAVSLGVRPMSKVLRNRKLFTANGEAIIHTDTYVPVWVYQDHVTPAQLADPEFALEPFFEFFAERCEEPVKYYMTSVRAEIASTLDLPEAMSQLVPNTPILVSENVGYSYSERPLFFEFEYIIRNVLNIQIVRRVVTSRPL